MSFLVGAAARSIQPNSKDIDNSLHCLMTVRLDEVGSPLEVKALACQLGAASSLMVVFDSVGIEVQHIPILKAAIATATGLAGDRIFLHATHSHSTPFLEPTDGERHPYFDLVRRRAVEAAAQAWQSRRPGRVGLGTTNVVGVGFNTRVPLPDGGVKFARDYREGLASGRPVDSRVHVLRFDDVDTNKPIAGWVRVAAHPACVVVDAPISAEYPGYMTDQLSQTVAGGAPVLFGLGACGDVNCIPMFGGEADSRRLGLRLADVSGSLFQQIETRVPRRFQVGCADVELPLAPLPDIETLDREIEEVENFIANLDEQPELEWVMGINCGNDWSVGQKKAHVTPLAEWARKARQAILNGDEFPQTRTHPIGTWVFDDLALVFDCGEPLVEVGLNLAVRSPLSETLLMAHTNGAEAYLCTDDDVRRGGYEGYSHVRYLGGHPSRRPLPYPLGAADVLIDGCLSLIERVSRGE